MTIKKTKPRKSVQFEVYKTPEVTGSRRVKFHIMKRVGFNATQAKRHDSALDLAEIVINSKEFKDKLTKVTKFTSSTQSGRQVYDKLMTGEEVLQKGQDYEFDIEVTLYESNNSTVGYTYANVIGTWVNNKFFKNYSLGEIAGNAVHEYMHKLGYGHTANYTSVRDQSVPYLVGYMIRDMVDAYDKGKLQLIDLYPEDGSQVPGENPTPVPVPPIEVKKKYVCSGFWFWKKCWYE